MDLFHNYMGALIRGERLFEGRRLFKDLWYLFSKGRVTIFFTLIWGGSQFLGLRFIIIIIIIIITVLRTHVVKPQCIYKWPKNRIKEKQ